MSRVIKIIAISMCFISTAFADDDDWGWRHHHHHQFYGYVNNGYNGGYVQPQRGYYPQPQPYYAPPPRGNYYGYAQQMPGWGRRDRDGRW
jgi:hypothetical protein